MSHTGIPGRYFRFGSRPPQESEYHSKTSRTKLFGFSMHFKSDAYPILQSVKCAIVLCLKKYILLLKYLIVKNANHHISLQ